MFAINNKENKDKRLVIGYIRESTKEQADYGYNLGDQEDKIKYYFKTYEENFKNKEICWMIEAGASAKNLKRPKMTELINLVKSNQVGYVIIHNLDRLVRRVKDLSSILELFQKFDVKLISITEKIDTATAQGLFFVYLIVLIAQWEQDTISERTKRGVYKSAAEGNYAKGGKVPFGFKKVNKKLILVEELRCIVDDLMEKLLSNHFSTLAISYYMKSHYSEYLDWTEDKIEKIARNPIYAGVYKDNNQIINSFCTPYVSWDEHQQILKNLDRRKYQTGINKYIYQNYLSCLECGCFCNLSPTNKPTRTYLYYICPNCGRRLNQDKLTAAIYIHLDKHLNRIYKNNTLEIYINAKAKLEAKEKTLKISLDENLLVVNEFALEMRKLHDELVYIQKKIDKTKSQAGKISFSNLSYSVQRDLLSKHIKNISVNLKFPEIHKIIFMGK